MAWGPGFRVKSKANNEWEDVSKASSRRQNELSGHLLPLQGFPGGSVSKKSTCNAGDHLGCKRSGFDPWVWKVPWRRKWQPPPVSLPGESHGQRSLADYSPWVTKSQTRLKQLSMHAPLLLHIFTSWYIEKMETFIWYTQVNWTNSGASIWSLVHPWFRTSLFVAVVYLPSCVWFFATPWTVAHQAPLSLGFSRQGYWSGLPCPPPRDLPDPGIKPASHYHWATCKVQTCKTTYI